MLAGLAEIKTGLRDLDERVERLEAKAYDTKPMWKNALKEIAETRVEMREGFATVNQEFDKIRAEMREGFTAVRAEMHGEFDKVRAEMREGFANSHSELRRLERKFMVFHDSLLDIRTDLREFDERLQKVEPEMVL